jgi:hypothetical protein
MNRLIIIGNGFDLAHGLKTSYKDFINWYWEQRIDNFVYNNTPELKDCLCTVYITKECEFQSWSSFASQNSYFKNFDNTRKCTGLEFFQFIKENREYFIIKYTPFFERITNSIETKGWVDIEVEYYELLKKFSDNIEECKVLNEQLDFLREKLSQYLNNLPKGERNNSIFNLMTDIFDPEDFAISSYKKTIETICGYYKELNIESIRHNTKELANWIPRQIMLLSFNYTKTARLYENFNISHNYIHGELSKPNEMIFGYGDELDKGYNDLRDRNENELLKYIKSVKYLETGHYRKVLSFIESAPFQVFIMGHSCGNSDRTLLNAIFEHENCVSIKPFYYVKPDGTDNHQELAINITRNFTNTHLCRDRVVNKERCQELPQCPKDTNE